MQYVIVDGWSVLKWFNTERGANISLTRVFSKKYPQAVVMSEAQLAEHEKNEPMHEVTNIMSGEKVLEKVSTPHYLSVSSETYWSR